PAGAKKQETQETLRSLGLPGRVSALRPLIQPRQCSRRPERTQYIGHERIVNKSALGLDRGGSSGRAGDSGARPRGRAGAGVPPAPGTVPSRPLDGPAILAPAALPQGERERATAR